MPGALGGGRMLRRGQGRGRPGPLRGKEGVKGGSRSRPDPPYGARGETAGAGYGRAEETKTLPVGVVFVEEGAPGGGRPLPQGKPGRSTHGETRTRQARATRDRHDRARGGETHRRAVGVGAPVVAIAEGRGRQAPKRPSRRLGRHTLGGEDGIVVAGDARGVRQVG